MVEVKSCSLDYQIWGRQNPQEQWPPLGSTGDQPAAYRSAGWVLCPHLETTKGVVSLGWRRQATWRWERKVRGS